MPSTADRRRIGYTFVELLIVIALLGLLAAVALTHFQPAVGSQLEAAAQTVTADLDYARSLAVAHGSSYRLTFDPPNNRYVLSHVGSNPAFHELPPSPLRQSDDAPTQQTTDLGDLPRVGPTVQLAAVRVRSSGASVTTVTFDELGAVVGGEEIEIWLTSGVGAEQRSVPLWTAPATGTVTVGEIRGGPPATGPG